MRLNWLLKIFILVSLCAIVESYYYQRKKRGVEKQEEKGRRVRVGERESEILNEIAFILHISLGRTDILIILILPISLNMGGISTFI